MEFIRWKCDVIDGIVKRLAGDQMFAIFDGCDKKFVSVLTFMKESLKNNNLIQALFVPNVVKNFFLL